MDNGESSYRRFLEGDKSGFDNVMDMYHAPLVSFITRYVGDENDAEDIAADTFLELLVHPSRFSFKCSLKTYIYSIARHRAVDFARKKRHQIFDADLDVLPDGEDSPADTAISKERKAAVREALANINGEYAEALYLLYIDGLCEDEIMRITKKNRRQLSNIIYRAKAAMKKELIRSGFSYEE